MYMTRLMDLTERSAFTADFKGQASIGQAWVKKQTKSKPSAGPANSQQTEKKVMLCSLARTGETHSYNT